MVLSFILAWSLLVSTAAPADGGIIPAPISAVPADALTGQWSGSMMIGPTEYPINLWFEPGAVMTGRIELIGVTSADNPLTDIAVSGDRVTFQLASKPPQKFEGQLTDGAIRGTIQIAGMLASFSVQKLIR